jgi:hypothetical protein
MEGFARWLGGVARQTRQDITQQVISDIYGFADDSVFGRMYT